MNLASLEQVTPLMAAAYAGHDAIARRLIAAGANLARVSFVGEVRDGDGARAFDPARLEDFLGAIVNIYGPRMLRYKGVLNMAGTDRKVIFQGVHQLMGSDLGPRWAEGEKRTSKMVFIGIDLPRDILVQGLEQSLV